MDALKNILGGLLLVFIGVFIASVHLFDIGVLWNYILKFVGALLVLRGGFMILKK